MRLIMFDALQRIIFCITDKCDLRCKYCLNEKSNRTISFNSAKQMIDVLMKSKKRIVEVNFSGGEPLMGHRIIKKIIEYANREAFKKKKIIKYLIISNGTILNEEIISMIKKNNIDFIISVDGSKESHDKNRIFRNGRGSYDLIKKNIEKMQDKGIKASISFVFNYNNDITRDLDALLTLRPKNVYINLEIHSNYDSCEKKAYGRSKRDDISRKIARWYVNFFEKNQELPPMPVLNQWLKAQYDYEKYGISTKKKICISGAGRSICVDEKSRIYPCTLYKARNELLIGNANKIDEKRYEMLRVALTAYSADVNFKKCLECRANKVCNKLMCPIINTFAVGEASPNTTSFCEYALFFFDTTTRIWRKLKKRKNFLKLIKNC